MVVVIGACPPDARFARAGHVIKSSKPLVAQPPAGRGGRASESSTPEARPTESFSSACNALFLISRYNRRGNLRSINNIRNVAAEK